jgi:hypothetical protein
MSGTAGVGLPLLGKLAAPAAKMLANRGLFRVKVVWRVRKRTDFKVAWRTYLAWLKTLSATELGTPVEKIAGPLAARLDDALCGVSPSWRIRPDHLSRALTLVELTYPASPHPSARRTARR